MTFLPSSVLPIAMKASERAFLKSSVMMGEFFETLTVSL